MSTEESMLDVYIYETQQLLQSLDDILLDGEGVERLDADQINEVFRVMHTIKGASAMMEFEEIAKVAHAVEDVFAQIRENGATDDQWPPVFDMVFRAVSFFNGELAKIQATGKPDGADEQLIADLHRQLAEMKGGAAPAPAASAPAAPVGETAKTEETAGGDPSLPFYKIKANFEPDCKMEAIRALGVREALKRICPMVVTEPENLEGDAASGEVAENGLIAYVQTAENPDELDHILSTTIFMKKYSVLPIDGTDEEIPESVRLKTGAAEEPAAEPAESTAAPVTAKAAAPVQQAAGKAAPVPAAVAETVAKQNFISVNVNKLDSLLNMVGEIVTAQSMVISNANFGEHTHDNFDAAAKQLHSLINELQDIVMSIRMLPVSTVFQKMRRLVRDMSKKVGKDVQLVMLGEETEVDKNVIDNLSDPLMHIIRNSVDHGIESPEERIKLGKPEKGKVVLEARTTGSNVVVTVSDDGGGLQRDKILKKAREKGLLTKAEDEMSDKEVYSLIFLPGFSTNENVTEFSGRGVGMDVVRKNIGQIGGTVSVESEPGKGTKMIIRIPLTLTIVDGMRFSVGNISFIVPTVSVKTAIKPKTGDIFTDPEGNEMIMLLGECYSVVRLSRLFNIDTPVQKPEDGMLMHLTTEEQDFCILFDHLDGEYQVVAKTLPAYLNHCATRLAGISGCAVLGDGSINLIVDVNGLRASK
jgi:two-component system, chemotaxis family, sensor kinase CheA